MPSSPAMLTPNVEYKSAERQQAIPADGLSAMMQRIRQKDFRTHVHESWSVLKLPAPYGEAD